MPDLLGFQLGRKYTDGSSVFDVDVTEQIDASTSPQVIPDATIDMNKINPIHYGQQQWDNGIGYWLGILNGVGKFSIGNSAGDKLTWDGTTLTINGTIVATGGTIGGFTIGSDYVRDVANSFGLSSTVTGGTDVRFWAGDTFANRATAPFRIYEDGSVVMTSATVNGIVLSTARVTPMYFSIVSSAILAGGTWNSVESMTSDDIRYFMSGGTNTVYYISSIGSGNAESVNYTTIWASATAHLGMVKSGSFVYIGLAKGVPNLLKIFRASQSNWAGGWTEMTPDVAYGTTTNSTKILSDNTYLYINNTGGDTAGTLHIWKKYLISGTDLTYVSTITCGATSAYFTNASMDGAGNFYGQYLTDNKVRRYDSTGTLTATQVIATPNASSLGYCFEGIPYQNVGDSGNTVRTFWKLPLLP